MKINLDISVILFNHFHLRNTGLWSKKEENKYHKKLQQKITKKFRGEGSSKKFNFMMLFMINLLLIKLKATYVINHKSFVETKSG